MLLCQSESRYFPIADQELVDSLPFLLLRRIQRIQPLFGLRDKMLVPGEVLEHEFLRDTVSAGHCVEIPSRSFLFWAEQSAGP